MQEKNPIITVLLNCVLCLMGLGYLYIGQYGKFAAIFIGQLVGASVLSMFGREAPALLIFLWAWTLYDGYVSTVKVNDGKSK